MKSHMGLKCTLQDQFLEGVLVTVTLLVFVCLILPLLIPSTICRYFYRWCLIRYVKSYRNDLVRIMADNSSAFGVDDLHHLPLCTIQAYAAFEGAGHEEIAENVRKCMIERDPLTKELTYPEAHQYFVEWMGYFWWQWEEDFNLDEHVTIWDGYGCQGKETVVDEKELMRIIGFLETKPYMVGRSPWEAIIIKNVVFDDPSELPKVVLIFRVHHGLMDGFAILNLFMKFMVADSMSIVPTAIFPQRNKLAECLFKVYSVARLPYDLMSQVYFGMDSNQWHLQESQLTRKMFKGRTRRIPIPIIKQLKTELGVGFHAVVISAIAGAFRKMMLKQKIKVPKHVHALSPGPFPDRQSLLGNHWSTYMLELNTGEEDPIHRLKLQQAHNDRIKSSTILQGSFYLIQLTNILPSWILRMTVKLLCNPPTIILSNFPGPSKQCFGSGSSLVDMMFIGGVMGGNIGSTIAIMSYHNAIRIVVGVDSAIFPRQELVEEFVELIENEFHILQEAASRKQQPNIF